MVFKSIKEIKRSLYSKEVSVSEVFDIFSKVAQENRYNEFITLAQRDEQRISESQKRIDSREDLPLDGIPCAIKDIFLTKGIRTTAASRALENFIPEMESTATEKLLAQGALNVGKTNMDEFAMGSTTQNSFFGPCFNPNPNPTTGKLNLNPGGSSGGSAVSVASGSSVVALGTDTGGSVRQPAALCGIVGMKPSYGLCSRYGMIAYASSLDQAGVMANNVEDAAQVLNIISGFDPKDSAMLPDKMRKFKSFDQEIGSPISGLKIAIIQDKMLSDIEEDCRAAIGKAAKELQNGGAIVDPNITIAHLDRAIDIYYVISTAECFSNLARFDGIRYGNSLDFDNFKNIEDLYLKNRNNIFGEEVKRRISVGSFVLSKENYQPLFIKAAKIRKLIKQSFTDIFSRYDAVLMPTTSQVAQNLEKKESVINTYLNDLFTVGPSCCGLPCISIPFGKNKGGLPLAVQIVSEQFNDSKAVQIASFLEQAAH